MGKIMDWLLDFFYGLAQAALAVLPDSPFQDIGQSFEGFENIMGMINYFVPVGTMLSILAVYLSAVLIWYSVRWVLRIANYID